MSMFGNIDVASSGLHVYRTWMDAISDNMANLNTAKPTSGPAFRTEFVNAQAVAGSGSSGSSGGATSASIGSGARVSGVSLGSATGLVVHDPTNPIADAQGNVRMPDTDLSQQMTQLIMAQRGYEANLAVVTRATESYQATLGLKI